LPGVCSEIIPGFTVYPFVEPRIVVCLRPSRRRWLGVPLNFNVIVFTARKEIATAVVYLDCTVLVTETEPSVDASISVALSLLLQE
jgi:hypothetical protein